MRIENDSIEITSGIRHGKTLGSPISFTISNRDWENWRETMSPEHVPETSVSESLTRPRPGHVDLAGSLKFQTYDIRNVLERASARETAARVAVGAICRLLLEKFDIPVASHVLAVGSAAAADTYEGLSIAEIIGIDPESPVRCADREAEKRMMALIDEARKNGDSLGGIVEVVAGRVPIGLGSHGQWDLRLDGQLAQAFMSIPSAKAVEIGEGVAASRRFGSDVHDEIFYDSERRRFYRKTNRAGGLEGGITNGSELRIRIYLKPIPTLRKPLRSVDLQSKETYKASLERSDTCVVPAAGVIAEAMLGFILARAFLEKFGGDSIAEIEANFANYLKMVEQF
jgi:chorismate synthase